MASCITFSLVVDPFCVPNFHVLVKLIALYFGGRQKVWMQHPIVISAGSRIVGDDADRFLIRNVLHG
jgi:hypothetical protein